MYMSTDEYRIALEAAGREYQQLAQQRADLDRRMAQLAQTIGSLNRLCGYTPTIGVGLTDACRMVLNAAGHPLTAIEVRQQLEAMGFDVSKYSNDLAPIHTVLKRLTESDEVQFVPRGYAKPAYAWKRAIHLIGRSEEHAEGEPPVEAKRPKRRKK
jgi:hypothetical protein